MFGFLSKIVLLLLAMIGGAATGYVYYHGGIPSNIFQFGSPDHWQHGRVHGAPGPLMGAGLPMVGIAYGVYRFVRWRRKVD
jgi:hypothetical protein